MFPLYKFKDNYSKIYKEYEAISDFYVNSVQSGVDKVQSESNAAFTTAAAGYKSIRLSISACIKK